MASIADYEKDPDETLDYSFDWELWLATGETITASVMTVSPGITKGTETFASTFTTVWLSGGTAGQVYRLSNKITTSQGRIAERSVTIRCTSR